jgi:hypothetical protein
LADYPSGPVDCLLSATGRLLIRNMTVVRMQFKRKFKRK